MCNTFKVKIVGTFLFWIHCAVGSNVFAQKVEVCDLKVEQMQNPLSVESSAPRFSWKITSNKNDTRQVQYELKVSTDSELKNNFVWMDKKRTDQSVLVKYRGVPLKSKTKYYWQVRIQDNYGRVSRWSKMQHFQTELAVSDWTAKWISAQGKDSLLSSPYFRKEITLKKKVKSALAYISAKGLYEAHLNGKKIGKQLLTPGWTSYKSHIQYQVFDISSLLIQGQNTIGMILGNGWYKGRIPFDQKGLFYGDSRSLIFQADITYTDGSKETINSDQSWRTTTGAILSSEIYDGETYDSRLEMDGWDLSDYSNLTGWKQVNILENENQRLVGMSGPGVEKHEVFKALKILKTPDGDTVVDFGQNLVGWVILKANGAAGTKISLRHAEVLDKNGNFYTANLRSAKQENIYILNGKGQQSFEPHFTFQGFRYVKVSGYPRDLTINDLSAIAIYSSMETTGKFNCSNEMLNQLQHNIQWGQKGNFVDVPTDCPQRDERLGWTGDAQAFASTAAYNMDVSGFFNKWLRDLKTDQLPNGSVPFVIPNVLTTNDSGAAGWSDAATIVPWSMYVAYGDKAVLEMQYESMKKWVDFISSKTKNNLWNTGYHFGDWLFYRPSDDLDGRAAVTDKYLIAQAFYSHSTQLLVNAAKILGKSNDLKEYTNLLEKIKAAFTKEYVSASGRLVSGTQTAYVLALQFDMLPIDLRQQAAERLVENIRSYQNHLTTGFLGTPYLCEVLTRFGFTDVAYDLLLQESYPSWLYPVKMGATTIWERWDGIKADGSFQNVDMNSFNHYAYGAIGNWMYKQIAGISPDEQQPGYKHIIIAPQPGGKLTRAAGELETVYGLVKSSWVISGGLFRLDVTVPVNTSATIKLPGKKHGEVIGSGTYHFETPFKYE